MNKLTLCAGLLLTLTACATSPALNTETNAAICEAWRGTLFLPSRNDTEETAVGLNVAHDVHAAACPQ